MTAPRILVVDDEADLRELLEITLLKMGLDVDSAATLRQARGLVEEHDYALILTDMRLPDGLGLELVREVTASHKGTPIAVITAYGSAENAVVALKAGAFDYISKPVALDALRVMVRSALKLSEAPAPRPDGVAPGSRMIGTSSAMAALRAQIGRLARSNAPISITGESGSGKELAAREIHAQSSRAGKPFVAVNCGAIPETLMEAEFFGYRKGAFTGAAEERDGFFQAANGGTLMLDEVADLPLPMQVKLLRAIQERRVRKIGATTEEPVDVRIISATHQDLAKCVEQGRFRQDLFYRLNVIELSLPPLRERIDDLAPLVDAILARPVRAWPGRARTGRARRAACLLLPGEYPRTGKRAGAGAGLCQRRRDRSGRPVAQGGAAGRRAAARTGRERAGAHAGAHALAGTGADACACPGGGGARIRHAGAQRPARQPARVPESGRARHHRPRPAADPVQPHPGGEPARHQRAPAALPDAEAGDLRAGRPCVSLLQKR